MKSSRSIALAQREHAQREWLRRDGPALDVAELPSFAFSHRSLMWWGTLGMIAIEGMLFTLAVFAYFYLQARARAWPMSSPPPDLRWGTLNTAILLASLVPNQWTKHAAEQLDLGKVRIGLVAGLLFALAFLLVRALEFTTLNVGWDQNAYGSIVWLLMGLHTAHLLTDFWDSAVLTVLMFKPAAGGRRFVDVSESGMYWTFVVLAWLPLYAVVYWVPRAG